MSLYAIHDCVSLEGQLSLRDDCGELLEHSGNTALVTEFTNVLAQSSA